MATEASKTLQIWPEETRKLLRGSGIDIGCGVDPIHPTAELFDLAQGDANRIDEFVQGQYDYVFSSHCLEHMHHPKDVIRRWYKLVKPGGHLIVLVPDEDLYEQGIFPSHFNSDHKSTFTLSKSKSWSPRSENLQALAESLGGEVISLELQDQGFDRTLVRWSAGPYSRWMGRRFKRAARWAPGPTGLRWLARAFRALGAVIDQTDLGDFRLAQLQMIVRKP